LDAVYKETKVKSEDAVNAMAAEKAAAEVDE